MTEIIYATQRVPTTGGRVTRNPVHFVTPEEGVKVVYLQDGFNNVRDAYEQRGVKVKSLSEIPSAAPVADAKKKE